MTKVIALKAFSYSDDGIQTQKIAVDAEIDVSDRSLKGLVAAGFVRVVGPAKEIVEPIVHVVESTEKKPARLKPKAKTFPDGDA